jgi:hypothetical protein
MELLGFCAIGVIGLAISAAVLHGIGVLMKWMKRGK